MDRTAESKVTDEYRRKWSVAICAADQEPLPDSTGPIPLSFGDAVPEEDFRRIQSSLSLDCCKWDAQIGDICTLFRLSRYPIVEAFSRTMFFSTVATLVLEGIRLVP
jgi:hypothetical protein